MEMRESQAGDRAFFTALEDQSRYAGLLSKRISNPNYGVPPEGDIVPAGRLRVLLKKAACGKENAIIFARFALLL